MRRSEMTKQKVPRGFATADKLELVFSITNPIDYCGAGIGTHID